MANCPCGSNLQYNKCCGLYHSESSLPPTPESLMRSRYTAYTMANIDYVIKTMVGKPLMGFDPKQAMQWSSSVYWLGLKIISHNKNCDTNGCVEFVAKYMEKDKIKTIHEISEFKLENGKWYYIDGKHPQTIASKTKIIPRNSMCPCESKKKFKNCHGNG